MRRTWALLCMASLAGCSFVIPPHRWHAAARKAEDGRASCPSYAYPTIDAAFGVPLLVLGAVIEVAANGKPLGDIAQTEAGIGMAVAAPWVASAIYGFLREADCHDELEQQAVTPADTGHATPAPPPPAPTPP